MSENYEDQDLIEISENMQRLGLSKKQQQKHAEDISHAHGTGITKGILIGVLASLALYFTFRSSPSDQPEVANEDRIENTIKTVAPQP